MKIELKTFKSLPEVLEFLLDELDKVVEPKPPIITTCYCEVCGAPLEKNPTDTLYDQLIEVGKNYLKEGAPYVEPTNLGDMFRSYLSSQERFESFAATESTIPLHERLKKLNDSDIENFIETNRDFINKGTFIIE